MKLYIANGQYVGTQAEAKAIDKGFEQVEVPTDKEGLISYLNGMIMAAQCYPDEDRVAFTDHFETVVERQDPPIEDVLNAAHPSPTIHDLWPLLPISTQLHFAALAVEEARDLLPKMKVAPVVEAEDLFS